MPGQTHCWLDAAVSDNGAVRSVYAHDTTLTRRGLLTRADRRARELKSVGIRGGDVVGVALGNVVESLVLLLACSKIDAITLLVDASAGDRTLAAVRARLPVRAFVRRPRGLDDRPPDYGVAPLGCRRLAGSLSHIDLLEPSQHDSSVDLPCDAEVMLETLGIGGIPRTTVWTHAALRHAGEAARSALELDASVRIVCAQPIPVPGFFVPVILGWLASEAQLVLGEGPDLERTLSLTGNAHRVLVVDTLRQATEIGRLRTVGHGRAPILAALPQATVPATAGHKLAQRLGARPLQMLHLDELGLLATRPLDREHAFREAPGVQLKSGAPMRIGGHEVLARLSHPPALVPRPASDEPGTPAENGWLHTGYAGRFNKDGHVKEILGRDDGFVGLEGRRGCLDQVELALAKHLRLTWVRAFLVHDPDGDPQLHVEYRATGQTDVEDLTEFAVGMLPPFLVPRVMRRIEIDA